MRSLPVIGVALVVAACAPTGTAGSPDGRLSVVTSFYPIHEASLRITGDRGRVTNLTPPGVEPHDVELTTDQVDLLLDADVVLHLGGGFQPAVEEVVGRRSGITVDLLEGRSLLRTGEHVEEPEGGGEEHGEEATDPHVWLDPVLMRDVAMEIADVLAGADPGGAPAYRDGARDYAAELARLHREYEQGLADCRLRTFVTSHAAFGYLAARYGLRQESISGLSPEAEPDPRRLAELVDLVEREGATTVFTETLAARDVAETLAREAGVDTAVLNPVEGLTREQQAAGATYLSLMRENLAALREALGCA